MIRHGEAEAGWSEDRDPGLSARGTVQASEVAERLVQLGPLDVVSSPLKRCRETSARLCDAWRTSPRIETAVAEIVSPTQDLTSRSSWLRKIFEGNWADTDDVVQQWKRGVPEALLKLRNDTVVFSHFVAINAAVGAATGNDAVVCFRPDNCSVTIFETDDGNLNLVELGHEAETEVR